VNIEWSGKICGNALPEDIGNLTALESLGLDLNTIKGPLPSSIGQLVNLQHLSMSDNAYLNGSIPSTIGNLVNLKSLVLDYNSLTGTIPESIGNLKNLTTLVLHSNGLSCHLPTSIGSLTKLDTLSLYENEITGPIPSSIGNLSRLTFLRLDGNKLSGTIPSFIGNLANLSHLRLEGNQLSGPIPSTIGNLKSLGFLGLSYNQLSGNIPSEIGNLEYVEYLWLNDNQLTGYPTSLLQLSASSKAIFPNPLSQFPFDAVKDVPLGPVSGMTLDIFLGMPVNLKKKRQQLSSSGSITTNELVSLCPLNNVQDSNVVAGCVSGIYNKFCLNPSNTTLLLQCQDAYNRAFGASIFKSLGAVCPAWKNGPFSPQCAQTVSGFSYRLEIAPEVTIALGSTHAADLVKTIFASPRYAPCQAPLVCSWK
jgi:hypothetical protein